MDEWISWAPKSIKTQHYSKRGTISAEKDTSRLSAQQNGPPVRAGRGRRWAERLLLGEVEAVELHHLGPGGDEVLHELLLAVGAGVDLGQGAELRVGAEDEVDGGRVPLHLAGLAVRRMVSRGNRLPLLSTTHLVLRRDVERAVLFGEPRL
ncbi:MAG: hypothetical protein AN484_24515 [Aphanizomenon flos-aquae WA102]|uniref:Uncharacterized protein n=1 Tax=Aphanizomenon flos-aquae WA102 TaxID=1710896 RepID=A0A1B7WLZ2_APHFL|nr:MAG: hypothetical protein AN484_24515 [Aphanizomenon flos-aquae WA102]